MIRAYDVFSNNGKVEVAFTPTAKQKRGNYVLCYNGDNGSERLIGKTSQSFVDRMSGYTSQINTKGRRRSSLLEHFITSPQKCSVQVRPCKENEDPAAIETSWIKKLASKSGVRLHNRRGGGGGGTTLDSPNAKVGERTAGICKLSFAEFAKTLHNNKLIPLAKSKAKNKIIFERSRLAKITNKAQYGGVYRIVVTQFCFPAPRASNTKNIFVDYDQVKPPVHFNLKHLEPLDLAINKISRTYIGVSDRENGIAKRASEHVCQANNPEKYPGELYEILAFVADHPEKFRVEVGPLYIAKENENTREAETFCIKHYPGLVLNKNKGGGGAVARKRVLATALAENEIPVPDPVRRRLFQNDAECSGVL